MRLTNKTILIVGASSGIGRALALELAKNNNRLIITARRENLLNELSEEICNAGSQCLAVASDALDETASALVVKKAIDAFNHIDVAVLNVGDGPSFNMADTSASEVKHCMRLNYDTMVNYLVPLIARMKEQKGGVIVQTNSLAGFLGLPMQGPYSAAKSAGRILFDACGIELAQWNIKMVSLHPGFIATEKVSDDGIPAPFEISETQAAVHMIKGIEREKQDYLFPFALKWLIRLARVLPKSWVGRLTRSSIPEQY